MHIDIIATTHSCNVTETGVIIILTLSDKNDGKNQRCMKFSTQIL